MARITVEDCLEKIDNQYDLVLLAKERTVQLNSGVKPLVDEDNDKRTIISLREIGDGKISVEELEKNAVKRLRKEPDEDEQQEDIEEETNDDFESLYKGQISKSGVAILPSKRTRRIPEVKRPESSNLAKEALSELKAEQPEIKEENLEKEEAPLELKEACDSNRMFDYGLKQRIAPYKFVPSFAVDNPGDVEKVEKGMKSDPFLKEYM